MGSKRFHTVPPRVNLEVARSATGSADPLLSNKPNDFNGVIARAKSQSRITFSHDFCDTQKRVCYITHADRAKSARIDTKTPRKCAVFRTSRSHTHAGYRKGGIGGSLAQGITGFVPWLQPSVLPPVSQTPHSHLSRKGTRGEVPRLPFPLSGSRLKRSKTAADDDT